MPGDRDTEDKNNLMSRGRLARKSKVGASKTPGGRSESLNDLYRSHAGKVSDKWSLYVDTYDRILSGFQGRPIRLLEIGVQNGGSLEIWRKYFEKAELIVGCDLNGACRKLKYDDEKVRLVIGDVNSEDSEKDILSLSKKFDVVIDDGSHNSSDVIESFVRYFNRLDDGGVYIIEDLHCSYWSEYGGGFYNPLSSMAFFKRLLDVLNYEHWGFDRRRVDAFSAFADKYNVSFNEASLASVHSIEFLNSLCVLRKQSNEKNLLGVHRIAGREALVDGPIVTLDGEPPKALDQAESPWSLQSRTIEEGIVANRDMVIQQQPKSDVAVVIPYYNGSKFIRRAVESVQSQTMRPAEFVVVNDGSRPEEAAFLHALAGEMNFVVLDKENGGQGSARNAGVAATSSPFICFLDQDDLFLPEHIEILRAAVTPDDRFGWAYADLIEADGNAQTIRTSMIKAYTPHPKTDVLRLIREDMFVLPSASIVSRAAFDAVGGFDPQFMGYEDDDLFLRMFRAGYTNTFIDRSVTIWCINAESTSYSIRMSRSRFRYFKKLYHAFPSDPVRAWFVLRDLLIPRFHQAFIGEAFQAICRPRTSRGKVLGPHVDELLQIAKDYRDIVVSDPYIGRRRKWTVRAQTFLLGTRSRLLCETALMFVNLARRVVR